MPRHFSQPRDGGPVACDCSIGKDHATEDTPFNANYIHTIEIPKDPAPPSLEDQIRGAMYSASSYHYATLIKCDYREAVLIDRSTYESLVAQSER